MQAAFQIWHAQKSGEVIWALMHSLHQEIKFHTFHNSESVYISKIKCINCLGQ